MRPCWQNQGQPNWQCNGEDILDCWTSFKDEELSTYPPFRLPQQTGVLEKWSKNTFKIQLSQICLFLNLHSRIDEQLFLGSQVEALTRWAKNYYCKYKCTRTSTLVYQQSLTISTMMQLSSSSSDLLGQYLPWSPSLGVRLFLANIKGQNQIQVTAVIHQNQRILCVPHSICDFISDWIEVNRKNTRIVIGKNRNISVVKRVHQGEVHIDNIKAIFQDDIKCLLNLLGRAKHLDSNSNLKIKELNWMIYQSPKYLLSEIEGSFEGSLAKSLEQSISRKEGQSKQWPNNPFMPIPTMYKDHAESHPKSNECQHPVYLTSVQQPSLKPKVKIVLDFSTWLTQNIMEGGSDKMFDAFAGENPFDSENSFECPGQPFTFDKRTTQYLERVQMLVDTGFRTNVKSSKMAAILVGLVMHRLFFGHVPFAQFQPERQKGQKYQQLKQATHLCVSPVPGKIEQYRCSPIHLALYTLTLKCLSCNVFGTEVARSKILDDVPHIDWIIAILEKVVREFL